MLSNAAKYAIRATIHLAIHSRADHKLSPKTIAEKLDVPTAFLAKLLQQLTKSRLISSTKGRNGGFYLSEANSEKAIWDVIHCIDGTEQFNECFLGLSECNHKNPCSIHELVAAFRARLRRQFKDKNIKQVAQEIIDGKEQIKFSL